MLISGSIWKQKYNGGCIEIMSKHAHSNNIYNCEVTDPGVTDAMVRRGQIILLSEDQVRKTFALTMGAIQ